MTTLPNSLLSLDLDHIIAQRPTTLTGVSPLAIQGVTFSAQVMGLQEGREFEVQGVMEEVSAEILINAQNYATLPSRGAVLSDGTGRAYKVLATTQDDPNDPVSYSMECIERYQSE